MKDTSGYTRAVSQVEDFGSVEFDLIDATGQSADGVEVTLTNTATGESVSAISANGTVVFEGVEAGSWTVASSVPEVTFTNVAIGNSVSAATLGGTALGAGAISAGSIAGGGGVAAGTAAVGVGVAGATAAGISTRNSDDDDDTPLSKSK